MTVTLKGTWHIDVKDGQGPVLPLKHDSKEIDVPSAKLEDLLTGVAELKRHINAQLTTWKDILDGTGETGAAGGDESEEGGEEEEED
jgi:hypothetical protein